MHKDVVKTSSARTCLHREVTHWNRALAIASMTVRSRAMIRNREWRLASTHSDRSVAEKTLGAHAQRALLCTVWVERHEGFFEEHHLRRKWGLSPEVVEGDRNRAPAQHAVLQGLEE